MPADPLNREFARLLSESGWTNSEAARQLQLTPAVITRYLNGETRPSPTVLKLFKLMQGDMTPLPGEIEPLGEMKEGARTLEGWEDDLINDLRRLPMDQQRKFSAIARDFLGMLPMPPPKNYPPTKLSSQAKKDDGGGRKV